jgi:hypothetical protein
VDTLGDFVAALNLMLADLFRRRLWTCLVNLVGRLERLTSLSLAPVSNRPQALADHGQAAINLEANRDGRPFPDRLGQPPAALPWLSMANMLR